MLKSKISQINLEKSVKLKEKLNKVFPLKRCKSARKYNFKLDNLYDLNNLYGAINKDLALEIQKEDI